MKERLETFVNYELNQLIAGITVWGFVLSSSLDKKETGSFISMSHTNTNTLFLRPFCLVELQERNDRPGWLEVEGAKGGWGSARGQKRSV